MVLEYTSKRWLSWPWDFLNQQQYRNPMISSILKKNMRVRPFRGTTHDISGFFCVGSLHSVRSHPFGVGSILNLPQKWTDKCWATMIDPNHTEDNHTITPKDFDKKIICSVRCTRPRMSSKRRGARPMRRCRGTWCLRVLWRIGLWASLSIHHPKNLQLEARKVQIPRSFSLVQRSINLFQCVVVDPWVVITITRYEYVSRIYQSSISTTN